MADDGLIGAVTSHGLNVQFAVQGNLEGENMLAGLLAYLVAVYIQGNGALVGINLYGSGAAGVYMTDLVLRLLKWRIFPRR